MSGTARYLYAISRELPCDRMEVEGIHGALVEIVRHHGLDAAVSDVDLDEFGEEALRRNFENLSWLEDVVRDHDRVVQALAALGPTAPLRLATVFFDDDGLRERVFQWRFALEQALDRVTGRHEWSVKVVVPQARLTTPPAPVPTADSLSARSGADYLRRKKEQLTDRVDAEERAARQTEEIHRALVGRAVASRLLSPQDPRLSGHSGKMVHNGAYLVADDQSDAFVDRLREVTEQHPDLQIEVGGPWPPYSFAMLEQR